MPSNRSRVLIADDHTLVGELCKNLLAAEFNVVGLVTNGHDLVQAADKLKPDVIVVDIAMPVLNGLDAGQQVRKNLHGVRLLYLTMKTDPELALEAFRRGASGYLLKTCAASELVIAVREVLKGTKYLSASLRERLDYLRWENRKTVPEADRLTERQREVLQLLAEGKVMKEIATILSLTTRTVAFHKYRIMEALGVQSSAELVRYAVRNHITAA